MTFRTKKQQEIMSRILSAVNEGIFLTAAEVAKSVSYDCSKDAMRVSLRFLIKKGVLVRERAGASTIYKPTVEAYRLFSVLPGNP